MRRLFLGLVVVAALAACNDSTPTGTSTSGLNRARTNISTASTLDDLDAEIAQLIALWPKNAKSFTSKWNDVKKLYMAGQTDPAKLAEAKKKLSELAALIFKLTGNAVTEDPTPEEATQQLILDMVLYVYGGNLEGDNITGLLKPDEALTLITPNSWAGLRFDVGSTDVNRIIVVTQNGNEGFALCDGPLLTQLCQYPLFYTILSVPSGRLLLPADVQICHPPEYPLSPRGPTPENHENLRLAHTKPAKVADYTPGGTIRNTPPSLENIEILPWGSEFGGIISLIDCESADYPTPTGGSGPSGPTGLGLLQRGGYFASAFASGVVKFLTPKSAYAIDQGFGGSFIDFSPFNYVDICSSDNPEPECLEGPSGPTGEGE